MKFRQATKPEAYPKRYVEGFVEKYDFIRTSSLKGCGTIGRVLRIFRGGKTTASIAPAENTREPSNGFRNGSVCELCNWLVFLLLISAFYAVADDTAARTEFELGLAERKAGNFRKAGEKFLAAELYADDSVLKLNALKEAATAFRQAKLRYKEFKCLQKILLCYPANVNFKDTVSREYELGTMFCRGERDPALWWMPWIDDDDRAIEIYETVLRNAPFSQIAPEVRLKLGKLYISEKKIDEAVKMFRETSKLHPGAKEAKFAEFEIANIYLQKSRKGDGDGKYARQAVDSLRQLKEDYPKDPETDWIRTSLDEADETAAKRLYGLASFYKRMENSPATTRPLKEILNNFPDTQTAPKAEEMLVSLDEQYKPAITEVKPKIPIRYAAEPMPDEAEKIIVVPENSDGKWLLPIEDLGIKKDKDGKNERAAIPKPQFEPLHKKNPKPDAAEVNTAEPR